jgi:hypothetical protein
VAMILADPLDPSAYADHPAGGLNAGTQFLCECGPSA